MNPGVLSRDLLIRWLGILLAASAVVSALVGWVGGSHGFDWTLAAVAGTAFGTIALAGFTGALAWTTSGDVQATWLLGTLTMEVLVRGEHRAAPIEQALLPQSFTAERRRFCPYYL